MGQTCCGATPDGPEIQNKVKKPANERSLDDVARTLRAVVMIQKHWRGMITRREIKETYGFVTRQGMQ